MRASNHRAAIVIGGVFFAFSLLSFGCGNPEAPQITNVRLSYWDSLTGDGSWVPLEDGGTAPQSRVRIQGNITDNTAVVSPRIAWVGERGDVDEDGFVACSEGTDEFYECEMSCEETREGFFECNPPLPASKLIRGDLFLLTFVTNVGEEYELQVQMSEAQDLLVPESEDEPIEILEDYRILRVLSLTEGPNPFLWSLFQRKVVGGPWLPLRSGDFLALGSGDETFQIAVEEPEGVKMDAPPSATWRSLVKWNDDSFLNWDASTGDFEEEFQIFDPRLRDPDSGEVIGEGGPPTYRYAVSAQDVPDQKTGVFRSSQVSREFLFSPETVAEAPDLEVDGEDEDLVETSEPAQNVAGSVESFSGEVRSLAFILSEGPESTRSRFLYFDPDLIALSGRFAATLVYVSDWNGDGIIDEWEKEGGIPNALEAVALDMQGNWTRTSVPIVFLPSTQANHAPELQIREIFPSLDKDQEATLPFGEELRVRARAADDQGQPAFSAWECLCNAEEPLINSDRCPCDAKTGEPGNPWVDLNAGGEFPPNPWQWIEFRPVSGTQKSIGVLRAKEKVEDPKDEPTARLSGIEIAFEPESEEDAYKVAVSAPDIIGPNVILAGLKNGDIVDPGGLIVNATIYANISELNQIKALWNGEPRGEPTFDPVTGAFSWDLQAFPVKEGDRICVGAISVTGHATLNLLEFADTSEGLLLAVSVTSDTQECEPSP